MNEIVVKCECCGASNKGIIGRTYVCVYCCTPNNAVAPPVQNQAPPQNQTWGAPSPPAQQQPPPPQNNAWGNAPPKKQTSALDDIATGIGKFFDDLF